MSKFSVDKAREIVILDNKRYELVRAIQEAEYEAYKWNWLERLDKFKSIAEALDLGPRWEDALRKSFFRMLSVKLNEKHEKVVEQLRSLTGD